MPCWRRCTISSRRRFPGLTPTADSSCGSPCRRELIRRGCWTWRLRQNVAFVPGEPFFPNGDPGSHMRLNFSNAQPEQIREGIRRLSIAVAHELEHRPAEVMV